VDKAFDEFEFARLAEGLYHFTWDEFCDWYLELAKVQLGEGGARADATRAVLGHVLDRVLRLLHPLMPFITERLWTTLTGQESLVVAEWAAVSGATADPAATGRIEAVQRLVTEIRRFRSEQGLPPGKKVPAELAGLVDAGLSAHQDAVLALARLAAPADGFAPTATLDVPLSAGTVTVRLDLSGVIDVEAERKRLAKDLAAAEKELAQCESKLGNPNFVDKAPADVVAKITARRETAKAEIDRLTTQLAGLPTA
jgi:valyl-tRNA synthetase